MSAFYIVKITSDLCGTGKVWVMKSGKRYGLWDFTKIWVIPANQVSGCQKSWVITGYGLSERWVMTESTVALKAL